MSTFWTPSGERPIPRDEPTPASEPAGDAPSGAGDPVYALDGPPFDDGEMDEELQAELMAMQQQMLGTPAAIVVANHCIGLVELAALHLAQRPPNLADAQISIDALGASSTPSAPASARTARP